MTSPSKVNASGAQPEKPADQAARPVRPERDQQVEAEHGRRQHQRQRHDRGHRLLPARFGARQPPGDRRSDDEEQDGRDRRERQRQPDGRPESSDPSMAAVSPFQLAARRRSRTFRSPSRASGPFRNARKRAAASLSAPVLEEHRVLLDRRVEVCGDDPARAALAARSPATAPQSRARRCRCR